MAVVGSPVSGNPLCPPFKNRPVHENNQLWIESTRATIGNYVYLYYISRALTIFLFPVLLLCHEGQDYYAHLIAAPPALMYYVALIIHICSVTSINFTNETQLCHNELHY